MSQNHCAIQGCKISIFNKPFGVSLFSCPTSNEMRNKWLHALRNRCALLDWSRSRVCSKHFEHKCFDSKKRLKENAIPTLFPVYKKVLRADTALVNVNEATPSVRKSYGGRPCNEKNRQETRQGLFFSPCHISYRVVKLKNDFDLINYYHDTTPDKKKIDKLMSKLTQSELIADIKNSMKKVTEPVNFENFVTDDLKCRPDASIETQLWLLIKKQDNLNNRLLEHVVQNKKHIEVLIKNIDEKKSSTNDVDQNVETYKYIIKCLQEKLSTLEEQIEILTAVESR